VGILIMKKIVSPIKPKWIFLDKDIPMIKNMLYVSRWNNYVLVKRNPEDPPLLSSHKY